MLTVVGLHCRVITDDVNLIFFQMKPDGKTYFADGFLHHGPRLELVSEVCRMNTWSSMPALAMYHHTMLLCAMLLLNSSVRPQA